jgi:hypothetical protein
MRDLLKSVNLFRRLIMQSLIPDYVNKKLKKRKGKCKKCGQCCRGCKHLKNNKCPIYKKRPFYCYKEFPIDKFDQKVYDVKNCGYKF